MRARKAAPAIAGLPAACARRGAATGASCRPTSLPRPGHDDAFALVLPEAKAVTMDLFLARFAETLPAGVHAVLMLDQAGWHGQAALQVPDNVTLLPLPPYSPELNPVERVWLYLRERFLSFRLYQGEGAIVDALCAAWNALRDETGRLATLTGYPWITQVINQVSR